MSPQVVNEVVTTYVHIACITWRGLLSGTVEREQGVKVLTDCKEGLAKYGYSFALIKRAGVVATRVN